MIAYVRGTLAEKGPDRVVIEAGGVGYELLIPVSTFDRLPREGGEAKLLAWHCVREDDEMLFGFATKEEREMFLKLTQVSGVGPKERARGARRHLATRRGGLEGPRHTGRHTRPHGARLRRGGREQDGVEGPCVRSRG